MSLKLVDFIPNLPPPVCGIVWDYEAGEQADLIRRDRALHSSEKSEHFRRQVQSEYDRNLRLFWVALIYLSTTDTDMRQGAFGSAFHHMLRTYPEWFDDADREFCQVVASLENVPTAANSIRKILHNRHLKVHLFPTLTGIAYRVFTPDFQKPPSVVVPEFSEFYNLKYLVFDAQATLVAPVDLRALPHLTYLDVRGTGLKAEDILLSQPVKVLTSEHPEGETIGPACWEQWTNWVINITSNIISACQRFFAWLISLFC